MGLEPFSFFQMTPHEITLAYNGFLERLEAEGNVMLMALRQRNAKKAKPITLRNNNNVEEGKSNTSIHKSTLQKRNETFKALGIK